VDAGKLTGALPAIDGSALTGVTASAVSADSVGTTQIIASTITLADLNTSDIDTRYVTTGTAQSISGVKTITSDWVNTANPWADNEVSDTLTLGAASSVNLAALQAGSLPANVIASSIAVNAVQNASIVSMASSKLTGALPAIDGSALTGVTASAVAANSVGTTQIIASTITLADMNLGDISTYYVTTGTAQNISGVKTITSDWDNTAFPWADNEVSDTLTLGAASSVNLAALQAGSLPGNVIASSIAVGAIGSDQILDGAIINNDISATAAIQLSKLEKDPSVSGVINNSTNPVDWTKLKNVPAAIADGTDGVWVEGSDVFVSSSSTIDFSTPVFTVTESPAGEANIGINSSSVTLQGNTFNGPNQLTKLNASGLVPNDNIDGSSITKMGIIQAGHGLAISRHTSSSTINMGFFPMIGSDLSGFGGTFNCSISWGCTTSATDVNITPMPVAGQVGDLFMTIETAPGAGDAWDCSIFINGAATPVTCQMAGAAATSCSDTTHTATIAAGDRIGVRCVETGTANNTNSVGYSFTFQPD
jgi:hypothetical protein